MKIMPSDTEIETLCGLNQDPNLRAFAAKCWLAGAKSALSQASKQILLGEADAIGHLRRLALDVCAPNESKK
jgi:hypothetical protein